MFSARILRRICNREFQSSPVLFSTMTESTADTRFLDFCPRDRYILPAGFERKDWHPKHMGIQLKVMEGKLRSVDLILEVHDARVAITGRNPNFGSKLYAIRPHILVLNKKDLVDMERYKDPIEHHYYEKGVENIFWTDCTKRIHPQWDQLRNKMLQLLQREHRFNRAVKTEYQVMVVGIPNVGKSSLINCLRKNNLGFEKAAKEGPFPGVTIRVQNRVRIWDRPPIYILDTPGILNPWVHNVDEAMKLAICNLILQSTTKPYFVADYLLYYMNRYRDFSYMDLLQMSAPSDDIKQVLIQHCRLRNLKVPANITLAKMNRTDEVWDIYQAADNFVDMFRSGKVSDKFLDRDLIGFFNSSSHNPAPTPTNENRRRKRG